MALIAVAYRLEPFIASRAYDPEADILPTWTGKLRVHYQVPTPPLCPK